MPSKSRRAASRQAQLKRRRRGRQRVQEFDAGPTESRSPTSDDDGADAVVAVMPASPASQTSQAPARRPHRSRRQAASEAALSYDYLGSELKQIGVITAMIAAVLVLLTFLLGG